MNLLLILLILVILIIFLLVRHRCEKFTNYSFLENNVTICVKTLYRKNLINQFLIDIKKKLPNINVIVVDDSDDEYKKYNREIVKKFKNTKYIPLPYDSGLSYSRNEAVKNVKTKYTIITDDSRNIDNIDILSNILNIMEQNPEFSLICGYCKSRGEYAGMFTHKFKDIFVNNKKKSNKTEIKNSIKRGDNISVKIKYIPPKNLEKIYENKLKLYKTHIGINCFIARTNILKNNPWNNKLKLQEHKHFFFDLFLNNIQVLYCNDFKFIQYNKFRKYDKEGKQMRHRFFKNNVNFKL